MEILSRIVSEFAISRRCPALLACVVAAFMVLHGALGAQTPNEDEVKAAFLLNFTKFVEWRTAASEKADSPITICLLGESQVGETLSRLVEGVQQSKRLVVARKVKRGEPFDGCHVLFISKLERDAAKVLAGLRPGVLSVGETEGFVRQGGMIGFSVENRRVRFDIHLTAATKALLVIHSRLLAVARSVEKQ